MVNLDRWDYKVQSVGFADARGGQDYRPVWYSRGGEVYSLSNIFQAASRLSPNCPWQIYLEGEKGSVYIDEDGKTECKVDTRDASFLACIGTADLSQHTYWDQEINLGVLQRSEDESMRYVQIPLGRLSRVSL